MFELLIKWIIFALSLLFVAWIIPGIELTGFMAALWAVLMMGIVNIFIKPVLVLLTIPINIVTLGLFSIVINALLFWLVSKIVSGFEVKGFIAALIGSILLSIITTLLSAGD